MKKEDFKWSRKDRKMFWKAWRVAFVKIMLTRQQLFLIALKVLTVRITFLDYFDTLLKFFSLQIRADVRYQIQVFKKWSQFCTISLQKFHNLWFLRTLYFEHKRKYTYMILT